MYHPYVEMSCLIMPVFIYVVYCLFTNKIRLLLDFVIQETFSVVVYVLLLVLLVLFAIIHGSSIKPVNQWVDPLFLYIMCIFILFSSIINVFRLRRNGGISKPLFANFIDNLIFACVFLFLFIPLFFYFVMSGMR